MLQQPFAFLHVPSPTVLFPTSLPPVVLAAPAPSSLVLLSVVLPFPWLSVSIALPQPFVPFLSTSILRALSTPSISSVPRPTSILLQPFSWLLLALTMPCVRDSEQHSTCFQDRCQGHQVQTRKRQPVLELPASSGQLTSFDLNRLHLVHSFALPSSSFASVEWYSKAHLPLVAQAFWSPEWTGWN